VTARRMSVERDILNSRVWRERALIEWTLGFQAGARDRDGRLMLWRQAAIATWAVLAVSAAIEWWYLR
jgi:hypothetical protein